MSMPLDQDFPSLAELGDRFDELAARDAVRQPRRAPRTSRRPVLLAAAACATAALVITGAIATFHDGRPGLSLAQRAYAEASAPGIAHWRMTIHAFRDGGPSTTQTEEGWADDRVQHAVLTDQDGHVSETRVADGQVTARNADGTTASGPAVQTDLQRALPGPDPLSAFRIAYGTPRLRQTAADTFAVTDTDDPGTQLTYRVTAGGDPVSLTETSAIGGDFRVVMTFDLYEHVPATPANAARLKLGG
jgi:hypothetical protein